MSAAAHATAQTVTAFTQAVAALEVQTYALGQNFVLRVAPYDGGMLFNVFSRTDKGLTPQPHILSTWLRKDAPATGVHLPTDTDLPKALRTLRGMTLYKGESGPARVVSLF